MFSNDVIEFLIASTPQSTLVLDLGKEATPRDACRNVHNDFVEGISALNVGHSNPARTCA